MRIALDSLDGLGASPMGRNDAAATICPTGSLVIKRVGYSRPYGSREYDKAPIGSVTEKSVTEKKEG